MAERRPGFGRRFFPRTLSRRQLAAIHARKGKATGRLKEIETKVSGLDDAPAYGHQRILVGRGGKRGKLVNMGTPLEMIRRRLMRDAQSVHREIAKHDRRLEDDRRARRRRVAAAVGGVAAVGAIAAARTQAGREALGRMVVNANPLKPLAYGLARTQERMNQGIVTAVRRFGKRRAQPAARGLVRKGFGRILGETTDAGPFGADEVIPGGRFQPGPIDRADRRLYEWGRRQMLRVPGLRRVARRMQEDARNFSESPAAIDRSHRAYLEDVARRGHREMSATSAAQKDSTRYARSGESAVSFLPQGRITVEVRPGRSVLKEKAKYVEARRRAQKVTATSGPDVEASVGSTVRRKGTYWTPEHREPALGELVTPGGQIQRAGKARALARRARREARTTAAPTQRERAILAELRSRPPSATIPTEILRKYNATPKEIADMQLRAARRKRGR